MTSTQPDIADVLHTLRRQVPIGFSGETRTWAYAAKITQTLSVPHVTALSIAKEESVEVAAEKYESWIRWAGQDERVAGHLERIFHRTEADDTATWCRRFSAEVHAAFLMPEPQIAELFHWKHTPGTPWIPSVAANLAQHIVNGPPIAAFIVAPLGDGMFAGSARPADKGETGVGLPGGKMDIGETARMTAIRETFEEGWAVTDVQRQPFHVQMDGKFLCGWFLAEGPVTQLEDYKEKGRLEARPATVAELIAGGRGNDVAFPKILPAAPELEM